MVAIRVCNRCGRPFDADVGDITQICDDCMDELIATAKRAPYYRCDQSCKREKRSCGEFEKIREEQEKNDYE